MAVWTIRHSDFLDHVFNLLNNSGIRYFVLRNYEGLPEYNTGNDVDIVIEPHSYKRVKSLILQCMCDERVPNYTVSDFDRMRCWYIMDKESMFGIHIDIIENEVYKGFEYFDFEYLYSYVIGYRNFYVLDKSMDTVMLLVQNIVAYKSLKQKYRNTISENYRSYKETIDAQLLKFWSKNVADAVIKLLDEGRYDTIVQMSKKLERDAQKSIFLRKPLKTFVFVSRFLFDKFWRVIICPSKFWRFFAVVAPDGTGKTTFLNQLVEDLCVLYVCDTERRFNIYHFRPSIFPNLGAAGEKVGIMKQDKNFTDPHRAAPAGYMSSFVRMCYYWLDYLIGVPFLLRKDSQYSFYTIFDRYIYDLLVDPKRSRIKLPYYIRKIFTRLVIHPKIVFVLQTTPETIYNRKQELSLEEISRQLHEYKKLSTDTRFVMLDASKSPREMSMEALDVIIDQYTVRAY